eukprot:c23418_g2_i2 orf=230-1501(+)
MQKGGVHVEKIGTPGLPEKNLMTRDVPAKDNEETKERKRFSGASEQFFSFLHRAFPCFEVKEVTYREADFSLEDHSTASDHVSVATSDVLTGNAKAIVFTMAELSKATSNFSSSCKIGQGGFAIVYKGKLRDGTIAAIKRAKKSTFESQRTAQFRSEVHMLASVEHLNLVRLIGFSEEGNERILVEEYVGNGNLRQHLDCEFNVVLDLFQRLDIAIDVAHALTYLHNYADQPIIHRDVKASNILLTESFRAKVADFGFSRLGPTDLDATHVSTQVKGTAGYLDPEYLKTYQLTQKSDVYSYGVLLVELFTGRRPIEQKRESRERITTRWAFQMFVDGKGIEVLDPKLERSSSAYLMIEKVLELAFQCAAPSRQERPTMKKTTEVLWNVRKDFRNSWQHCDSESREQSSAFSGMLLSSLSASSD